ncbi:hypothetical protein Agub_g15582, partial [Astrephomene gubernaculifera]
EPSPPLNSSATHRPAMRSFMGLAPPPSRSLSLLPRPNQPFTATLACTSLASVHPAARHWLSSYSRTSLSHCGLTEPQQQQWQEQQNPMNDLSGCREGGPSSPSLPPGV